MADGKHIKVLIDVVATDKGAKDAKKAVKDVGDEAKRINAETTQQAKQQYKVRQEAHRQSTRQMEADIKRLEQEEKRAAKSAADAFIKSLKDVENERKESAAVASAAFRSSAGVIGAVIAAEIYGIGKLGETWIRFSADATKVAADFQRTRNALTAVSGSSAIAREELGSLEALARNTPGLGLETAEQGFLRLRSVGFEAERARELLSGLSRVKILSGAQQADLEGVLYNLTQIRSMGRLTGDELRESLGRMPALAAVIQRAFGTIDTKKIAALELTSDEFFKRLTDSLKETQGAAGGLDDSWQKLTDQWLISRREFGTPILEPATDSLKILTEALAENKEAFAAWGNFTADVLSGINTLAPATAKWIEDSISGTSRLSTALNVLTFGAHEYFLAQKRIYDEAAKRRADSENAQKYAEAVAESFSQFGKAVELSKLKVFAQQTEEAKKQAEFLKDTVSNLNLQVRFFGDESQVASTKQALLTKGISDFNSGLAKSAVSLAKQLDNLKDVRKASDFMRDLRDNTRFQAEFPKATELNKFDFWVRQNVKGFSDLKFEIEATRRALESKSWRESFKEFNEATTEAFVRFDNEYSRLKQKLSGSQSFIADFGVRVNIMGSDTQSLEKNAADFAGIVENYLDKIDTVRSRQKTLKADSEEMQAALKEETRLGIEFQRYLLSIQSKFGGNIERLFGDKMHTIAEFEEKVRRVRAAIAESKLDEIFDRYNLRLGDFGQKTELEKLNEELSNPSVTKAVEDRALALGMTADQLKNVIRAAKPTADFNNFNETLKNQLEGIQRGNKPLSEFERVQREISKNYSQLSDAQKKDLLNTAQQIDAANGLVQAQEKQKQLLEQTTDFFRSKIEVLRESGFKGLFKSLLDDLTDFLTKAAAKILASKFLELITGQKLGGSGSGFNISSLFGGLFNRPGATPNFNPNASGGGILGTIQNLFGFGGGGANAHGALSGLLGTASGIGIPALTTAAHAGTAAAPGALASVIGAGGGAAGGILGSLGSLTPLLTNPWTLAAVGAGIGGYFLFKSLFGSSPEKKLKKAAESAYSGLKIKDKNILKSLKGIGDANASTRPAGKHADAVVRLEASRDLLTNYAEATGQKVPKLTDGDLTDEFNPRNNFSSRFSGFVPVPTTSAVSSFSSDSASYSSGSTAARGSAPNSITQLLVNAVVELTDMVHTMKAEIKAIPPGDFVGLGLKQNPTAASDAYTEKLKTDGDVTKDLKRYAFGES